MNDIILLKQGEIILKGLNRREFENKLLDNVRRRLGQVGCFKVYAMQSTVYAEPQEDVDMEAALEAARTVFGALSVVRAAACEKDKDKIIETVAAYLGDEINSVQTFKVESKRADKRFPMSSIELSRYVGGEIHNRFPHLKPDMHTPQLVINIEIRDLAAYVHGPATKGAGGLPVGTGGRMVTLLSGGIDSPVASYMMAKRGIQLIPVHFYSHPYTSVKAKDKVLSLAQELTKYCGRLKVELVPFTRISEEIREKCPEGLITVIMRRFMMRIAERIAQDNDCVGLITGDNLGQVASQTAQAIAVAEKCVDMPVFRPLIAFDKREIVDMARDIGTFETSILPFEDCCTVFTPKRPRTRPKQDEVTLAESKLDIENLVEEALNNRERVPS
ncbi:MAG: tRNA 4-thiouridine(8) synthase ThiI [Oscillospiraceae bacterium]|nr:tRNA 4-thiouridine(8) synthase ThiI [Oscillospiraceae bacterium]MCL2279445.1 tRNA 4-thiouridine(8) synthase ThiI [Oscillospiraceae bacterium]